MLQLFCCSISLYIVISFATDSDARELTTCICHHNLRIRKKRFPLRLVFPVLRGKANIFCRCLHTACGKCNQPSSHTFSSTLSTFKFAVDIEFNPILLFKVTLLFNDCVSFYAPCSTFSTSPLRLTSIFYNRFMDSITDGLG